MHHPSRLTNPPGRPMELESVVVAAFIEDLSIKARGSVAVGRLTIAKNSNKSYSNQCRLAPGGGVTRQIGLGRRVGILQPSTWCFLLCFYFMKSTNGKYLKIHNQDDFFLGMQSGCAHQCGEVYLFYTPRFQVVFPNTP
eukprot:GEMP01056642.1.p1 GENE.GEMP01056642.1~~GEMP01056642.1.p1  ORF type:complete len:139 (+),score=1.73 GEMP01056642.1:954-1370(+)